MRVFCHLIFYPLTLSLVENRGAKSKINNFILENTEPQRISML